MKHITNAKGDVVGYSSKGVIEVINPVNPLRIKQSDAEKHMFSSLLIKDGNIEVKVDMSDILNSHNKDNGDYVYKWK